jgi:hypothetical protein
LGKRKRPQSKVNLSEPGLKEATVSVLNPSSTIEVSPLASAPNLCPFTSFWMSPEAVSLCKPVDDESVLQAIDNQVSLLEEVNKSEFGYIGLVKNIKEIDLKDASGFKCWPYVRVYVFNPTIDPHKREYEPIYMEIFF